MEKLNGNSRYKKVTSVEAFKNRQYRYQMTEYGVEIERMTVRLEHLYVEGLHIHAGAIGSTLQQLEQVVIETVLKKVVEYEMTIPRIDAEISEKQFCETSKGRWKSIRDWFVGEAGKNCVVDIRKDFYRGTKE